jgi:[ribosomal protein S5]-alanine N-acetyltransferase
MSSGDVRLRPPVDHDRVARQALGITADIARMFGANKPSDRPMTDAAAAHWFAQLGAGDAIEWVIEVAGRFVGTARLHTIDRDACAAAYAIGLFDPTMLGQGVGRTATGLVCGYAFDTLQLHKVSLRVLDFNVRAHRSYVSVGFVETNRIPSGVLDHDRHAEDIIMVLRRESWEESGG